MALPPVKIANPVPRATVTPTAKLEAPRAPPADDFGKSSFERPQRAPVSLDPPIRQFPAARPTGPSIDPGFERGLPKGITIAPGGPIVGSNTVGGGTDPGGVV